MDVKRVLNEGSQTASNMAGGYVGGIAPPGGPIDTGVVTGNIGSMGSGDSINYGDFSGGDQSTGVSVPRIGGGGGGGVYHSSAKHNDYHNKDNDPSNDPAMMPLFNQVINFEKRVLYPYMDNTGNVTIGIGHEVTSKKQFLKLPLIDSATGKYATKEQKKEAWHQLQDFARKHPNEAYTGYKNVTKLTISQNEEMSLYHNDFNDKVAQAEKYVNKYVGSNRWNSMPQSAKNAIIDMSFNIGAKKLHAKFTDFTKALRAGNYAEAAAQSHIKKINNDRNNYNRQQLLLAAGVK